MKRFTNKQECLDWLVNNYENFHYAIRGLERGWCCDGFSEEFTMDDLMEAFENKHTDLDSKQQLEQRVVESFGPEIKKEREDLFKITDEHEALRIANKIIKVNHGDIGKVEFKRINITHDGAEIKIDGEHDFADMFISEMGKRADEIYAAVEIKETITQRSAKYGEFEVNSKVMQGMKKLAKTGSSWDKMSSYQKEAVEMILHKIGRIVCGDPDYIDSWHDIAGYAKLVEDILSIAKRDIELNGGEVE